MCVLQPDWILRTQAHYRVLPITDEVTELIMQRDLNFDRDCQFCLRSLPVLRCAIWRLTCSIRAAIDLASAADSVRLGLISQRDKKWQPTS